MAHVQCQWLQNAMKNRTPRVSPSVNKQIYIYIYISIDIYIYIYIYAYMINVSTCYCMHVCTDLRKHVRTHVPYVCTYMCT